MGIAVPPAMASRLAEGVQLESDTGLVTPQGSGEVVALSTEIGGKAGASSEQTPTDLFSRITQPQPFRQQIICRRSKPKPAKLAGFERKACRIDTGCWPNRLTATVQPGNATQLGMNASPARTASSEQMHIETPLKNQAWPAEFGQKIVWMTTQDKQSAQITLNPPQLGPIEISLNVKNDQATAVFVSANAEVRAVIESAMPRLREMLEGAGVQLGQTNVSAESFRQSADGRQWQRQGRATLGWR